MTVQRLAASGRLVGSLPGGRFGWKVPTPQAATALLAPAAMAVGAIGMACLWNVLPKPAHDWAIPRTATGAIRPVAPADGPLAAAALKQSAAMSRLLVNLGAVQVSTPELANLPGGAPVAVERLRDAEADMIATADQGARDDMEANRALFRTAGLDPRPYAEASGHVPGISRLELRDARVLAARMDIDTGLAKKLQRAAQDLIAAHSLAEAAHDLPLGAPVSTPALSSSFGMRIDPFRGVLAFHPGLDFPGSYGQTIHSTGAGVVSFVGQRTGYGNVVEIDHGHGFKTRYGHLSGFDVRVGEPVQTGDAIARMGSTGRSTGVHVHYEVWASGQLQNPNHFLKAGQSRG